MIPSKARKDFGVKPGDLLLVVRGPGGGGIGLGLIKVDLVREFMKRMMNGLEVRTSHRVKE